MPAALDPKASAPSATGDLYSDAYGEEELDLSRDDFEALLSQHQDAIGDVKEGEIVKAEVLRVTDSSVILDFGFKSEGSVSKDEFKDADSIEPGQVVEVLLESLENEEGVVVLSKKKADFLRVWEKIKEAHEADVPVEGTLVRKIKGGVTVDLMGVDAFLPGSQIALRRVPNIEDLLGHVSALLLHERPAEQHLGIALDHGELIAEIVSDAAGQMADRPQLLRLPKSFFGLYPLGDVGAVNVDVPRIGDGNKAERIDLLVELDLPSLQ